MKYMKLPLEARERLMASLRQMPSFLFDSFSRLPGKLHAQPGPDGGFSPVEQAWHLADLETMGFADRIRRLRTEAHPRMPDFAGDVVARERNYKSLSLADGLEAFRHAREQNLSVLSCVAKDEWTRRGEQAGYGLVSLCDMPSMMAEHDESHRREIESWLSATKPRNGRNTHGSH